MVCVLPLIDHGFEPVRSIQRPRGFKNFSLSGQSKVLVGLSLSGQSKDLVGLSLSGQSKDLVGLSLSGQSKDLRIGICCFTAKQGVKSDWLAQNQCSSGECIIFPL
jgi:hypothetical protein